jgi:gluconate 2-dehydrogenase gamma chain
MTADTGETERLFFDEHQWKTVEAAMARIIPTDQDPGAREANTVRFVDRYLSGVGYIYAKPDGSGFLTLSGRVADVWHRRIENLRGKYVEGVAELDRISQQHFRGDFVRLAAEQQDRILEALARPGAGAQELDEGSGTIAGLEMPEAGMQQMVAEHQLDFFPLLALHTRQGFYADPIYGGNTDHVGWRTIGFPGPASMAEVHRGEFSTLPYFAPDSIAVQTGGEE